MEQYLAILFRNEFNLVYRFGYGIVSKKQLIPFDGTNNESLNIKLTDCFDKLTPFEYDEEYIILHLSLPTISEEQIKIQPENINSIFPLSRQAKASIESKLDSRIRLEDPIFDKAVEIVKERIQRKSIEMAIDAVFKICALDKIEDGLIELDEIVNGQEKRKFGAKEVSNLNGSFWEILIAYDRYDYFPNSTLGYLYDVGNAFSYYKGNRNGVIGTSFHQFLERLNSNDPNIKLPEIISKLEEDPERSKFIEECKIIGKGKVKPYLTAILFLKWKDELRNPEKTLASSNVFHNGQVSFYNKYPDEVRLALYLLAAFFGFNRFYDEFYNVANHKFFKNYSAKSDIGAQKLSTTPTDKIEINEISGSRKDEASKENVSTSAIQNNSSSTPTESKKVKTSEDLDQGGVDQKKNAKKTDTKKGKPTKASQAKPPDQPKLDL